MKQSLPLLFALCIAATPAAAQDEEDGSDRLREGWGLLSEGSRLLLEGLADEMRPVMDDHVLPFLAELSDLMDDVTLYEMPEMLPNGDIIIRRSEPLEPETGEDSVTDEPVDL